MARCDRGNGITYLHHKYKDGVCEFCGAKQVNQLRALANRREKRRQLRRDIKAAALASSGVPQV